METGVGQEGSFRAKDESTATRVHRAKWRFTHRRSVLTSTHQPERLVCSPAGEGGCWELRFRLWSSDTRERTGVGCVNIA